MPEIAVQFGTRLHQAVQARGPLCVGIDPHPEILQNWGLPVNASGLERCARTMIENVGGNVALIKPQSAFFEFHGSAGIAVLERILADARSLGTLVLLDVKRGDIGSTMAAYAHAYLADGSALAADAITVSPYLGVEALDPAFELAAASGRGVFLLALTSNRDAEPVQLARSPSGRSVAQGVVNEVAVRNAAHNDGGTLGPFGLVVGATHATVDLDLSRLAGPILAPGFGAQGGTPDNLRSAFAGVLDQVVPSSSRGIMSAGPDPAAIRQRLAEVAESVRDLQTSSVDTH